MSLEFTTTVHGCCDCPCVSRLRSGSHIITGCQHPAAKDRIPVQHIAGKWIPDECPLNHGSLTISVDAPKQHWPLNRVQRLIVEAKRLAMTVPVKMLMRDNSLSSPELRCLFALADALTGFDVRFDENQDLQNRKEKHDDAPEKDVST